jgi:hypothetical protein
VKLFGHSRAWRQSHAAERGALALVATDPEIARAQPAGRGTVVRRRPWLEAHGHRVVTRSSLEANSDFIQMMEQICRVLVHPVGAGPFQFLAAVAAR